MKQSKYIKVPMWDKPHIYMSEGKWKVAARLLNPQDLVDSARQFVDSENCRLCWEEILNRDIAHEMKTHYGSAG